MVRPKLTLRGIFLILGLLAIILAYSARASVQRNKVRLICSDTKSEENSCKCDVCYSDTLVWNADLGRYHAEETWEFDPVEKPVKHWFYNWLGIDFFTSPRVVSLVWNRNADPLSGGTDSLPIDDETVELITQISSIEEIWITERTFNGMFTLNFTSDKTLEDVQELFPHLRVVKLELLRRRSADKFRDMELDAR